MIPLIEIVSYRVMFVNAQILDGVSIRCCWFSGSLQDGHIGLLDNRRLYLVRVSLVTPPLCSLSILHCIMARMSLKFIIFDLDNTLYPPASGMLKELGRRIELWLRDHFDLPRDEAVAMRRDYFLRYGTTLGGLVARHDVDARDFLAFVHDVPVEEYLDPHPALAAMLDSIPLRRAIYTNAPSEYAGRVVRALGVACCFERVIGIEEVGLRNKPSRDAYERALALLGARGSECMMVEDSPRNLRPARALGMATVLVGGEPDESADFVLESVLDVGEVVAGLL